MTIGRHTDNKGRSTGERVAAVQRGGSPVTDAERTAATRLLDVLLDAAAEQGHTLDDFDWTIDLPGGCLDVIRHKSRDLDDALWDGRGIEVADGGAKAGGDDWS